MFKQDRKLLPRTVVFADDRPFEAAISEPVDVRKCWRLGGDVAALAAAIASEDVDVVVIQHQPGLLDWSDLTCLLQDSRLRNRHVVVTLHSTSALQRLSTGTKQAAVNALRNASRILVHTVAELNQLKAFGLLDNVTFFPHGAPKQRGRRPPRNLSSSANPLIGCYGFFLPHKGISRLIEAVAVLQEHWPNLRLRLVNAVYPGVISTDEVAACRATAARLGIEQSIEWITDFLSHEESVDLLSECDLVVLPYDESEESVSGAARIALVSGAPVATTTIRLFIELGDAVARVSTSDLATFVDGLRSILSDLETRRRLQETASAWLNERDWPRLARRLGNMLSGLHAVAPRQRALYSTAQFVESKAEVEKMMTSSIRNETVI
jgi:glycosyltransferase involved in cell wall biosynthesis